MEDSTVDLEAIRKLYAENPAAQTLMLHLAGRTNDQAETKIDRILGLLRKDGTELARSEVIGVFRTLEKLNCGGYVEGRHGHPSRFRWAVGLTSLSKAAMGQSISIDGRVVGEESIPAVSGADEDGDDGTTVVEEIGEVDGTGLEEEDTGGSEIREPFDPAKIRVETKSMVVSLLLDRIRNAEIDLMPGFQRKGGIWSKKAKSQLIESMLIRIPLPAFYMDGGNENRWLVVDGLQRLSTMKSFVLDKSMKLTGLEFLKDYEGKTFDDLPRNLQRRILETQVTVFLIQENTPPEVKFNIFKRINTGGLPLSSQEIRHALNQGQAVEILQTLTESAEFKTATRESIRDNRMGDRECVLRVLAFMTVPYLDYGSNNLDVFLNNRMAALNRMSSSELTVLKDRFRRAMHECYRIFGERAFRKQKRGASKRFPINRALFEVWATNVEPLSVSNVDVLVEKKAALTRGFIDLLEDDDFAGAITYGTGDPRKVHLRFSMVEWLIQEVLNDSIDQAN